MEKIVNSCGTYVISKCQKLEKKGTIIFIHGFATTSEYHDNFISHIRDEYDYIALQLPGAGRQEWTENKRPTVNDMVNYCVSLINSLNLDSFILIGHSMGGGIAPRVANILKSKIRCLVCVTPMNSRISPFKIFNYFLFNPKTFKKNYKLQNILYHDLPKTFHNDQEKIERFLNDESNYQLRHRKFFVQLKKSMFSIKNLKQGRRNEIVISCPTLAIAGRYDKIIPFKSVYKAFKWNKYNKEKDIQFEIMEQSAHLPFQEQEMEYVNILKEFIDQY